MKQKKVYYSSIEKDVTLYFQKCIIMLSNDKKKTMYFLDMINKVALILSDFINYK